MKQILIVTRTLFFCIALGLTACATTRQAGEVTRSGFLGDYSRLKQGKDDQALLSYRNPEAPWGRYDSVIIDPVSVYAARGAELRNDSKEEQKALANYFTSSLQEQLKKHFKIVRTPGRNVLRVRAALTDGDQSEVLLDTITTIMPIGLAISTIKSVAGGEETAVGFAQAEAEVVDSESGVRLAAAVDKRYGTKALRSKFGSWNHAQEAIEHWAEQIAERLTKFGAGKQ